MQSSASNPPAASCFQYTFVVLTWRDFPQVKTIMDRNGPWARLIWSKGSVPRALFAARWLSDSMCAAGLLGWARLWGLQNEQRHQIFPSRACLDVDRPQCLLEFNVVDMPDSPRVMASAPPINIDETLGYGVRSK